jgi:DNA-binding CsgD family transcriptional regulator
MRRVGGTWPFVGRREQLARVAGASGPLRGCGVVVVGPPGAGRTEFARAATRELARRDADVHWAVGSDDARATPLGAFAHLLTEPSTGGLEALVAAAAALVQGPRRTVVVVDDAHLLDPLSATLVQQLVVGGRAGVLLTVEDGAVVPDALRRLWKDGLVERVELTWLTRAEVAEVMAAAGGAGADDAQVERLYGVTGGAPRLLRGVLEDGPAVAVGARLAASVDAELAALSAAERSALELVAFAGIVALADLERAAGQDAVAALDARGVVVVSRSRRRSTVRVRVPVVADAVRAAASPLHADAVRASLLALASGRRSRDLLLRVSLLAAGGRDVPAADLASASRAAAAEGEHAIAAGLAARALAADPALPAVREAAAESAVVAGDWAAARALGDGARAGVVVAVLDGDVARARSSARRTGASDRDAAEALVAVLAGEPVTGGAGGGIGAAAAAYGLALAGRPLAALEVAGERDGTALAAPALDVARVTALRYAGRLDDAAAYASGVRSGAAACGARTRGAVGAVLAAQVALDAGLPRTALRALREVLASPVPFVLVVVARCVAAQAELLVGGVTAAGELVDGLAVDAAGLQPLLLLTLGWLAVARGRDGEGAALAREAASYGGGVRALHAALRMRASDAVARDLIAAAEGAEGALLPELGRHGAAYLGRDPDALDAVAGRLAATGARLLAADALVHAARLRHGAGSTSLAFARRLLGECEGAATPLTTGTAPASLTRRESEVATLAANGLSNRAIAERLVVSVRTVEGHLARAYAGLGVRCRGDLAAALGIGA